ncbi:MAG: TM2 domain-containing protein [Pseudomonadota bacterium]
MAFGKRGAQQPPAAQPAFVVAASSASAVADEPAMKGGLFGGGRSDDFDINLSFMQPYGEGKSVLIATLLWLVFGGLGGHRFYLGHARIGFAILTAVVTGIVCSVFAVRGAREFLRAAETGAETETAWIWLLAVAATASMWAMIDGIYVICRMLSAKTSN